MVLKGLKSQKDIYITHKPGGHMLGYSWEDHVYLELSMCYIVNDPKPSF